MGSAVVNVLLTLVWTQHVYRNGFSDGFITIICLRLTPAKELALRNCLGAFLDTKKSGDDVFNDKARSDSSDLSVCQHIQLI